MHHELKIRPPFFQAVLDRRKTFEVRENDRGFNAGDTALLREYDDSYKGYARIGDELYTGREIKATIGYVSNYEQQRNYVVLSLILDDVVVSDGELVVGADERIRALVEACAAARRELYRRGASWDLLNSLDSAINDGS